MVDCFVSSFRINYRNNQHFDICLQPNSPIIYHLAYVKGTYSIVKEVKNSCMDLTEIVQTKRCVLEELSRLSRLSKNFMLDKAKIGT